MLQSLSFAEIRGVYHDAQFFVGLELKLKAFWSLGKHLTNWVVSQSLTFKSEKNIFVGIFSLIYISS